MASHLGYGDNIGSYFKEVADHFATLSDPDEKALLAANAIEEVAGQELQAATSPATAFILEKLLAAAETSAVLSFLKSVLDTEDAFGAISSNATGSRIMEAVMQRLADDYPTEDATQTGIEQALEQACNLVAENLVDCVTDRCGSHVARRLLSIGAGRDVSPVAAKKKQSTLFEEDEQEQQEPARSGRRAPSGLAARLAFQSRHSDGTPAPFPQLVQRLVTAALEHTDQLPDLAYHPTGSPFLQAMLSAIAGDGSQLHTLTSAIVGEHWKVQDVHTIMQDRTASHVFEALLAAATDDLYQRLYDSFLAGSLKRLALHPIANFGVQAALAAARTAEQVKAAVAELADAFGELLSQRRSGVVAALLAAAGRLRAAQSEACRALSRGLTALPWSDSDKRGLAVALMSLNGAGSLGDKEEQVPAKHRSRLSTPGCAILALLLQFPLDACQKFTKAVAFLSPADAAAVGLDPGGTRVLEAFMQGKASAKQKKALLRALQGSWGVLAAEFGSSHLVQKCYDFAGPTEKEAIVGELAANRKMLYSTGRGGQVLNHTGADIYARSPEQWRQQSASVAAVRSEFAAIIEGATPAGAVATATDKTDLAAAPQGEGSGGTRQDQAPAKQAGKKRKKESVPSTTESVPVPEAEDRAAPNQKVGRDKSKRAKEERVSQKTLSRKKSGKAKAKTQQASDMLSLLTQK